MGIDTNGSSDFGARTAEQFAAAWLAEFEEALTAGDASAAAALFTEDGSWRDLVAFTWHIRSYFDPQQIEDGLNSCLGDAAPKDFSLDLRSEPEICERGAGRQVVEAYFTFSTATGRGNGSLRLLPTDDGSYKAWTLMTGLKEIDGHEPRQGGKRPKYSKYAEGFGADAWTETRASALAYEDDQPTVLIVGAGQAGLTVAARLRAVDIDALVIDRHEQVGDSWRNRYNALRLHTSTPVNHLPFMPYPETTVDFISKDQYAGWLGSYAEAMELNVWTGTDVVSASYDEESERWVVKTRKLDGTGRTIRPGHLVLARGRSDEPNLPTIPGLDKFFGDVIHSSEYETGAAYKGKSALVFGCGNSGMDIAHDLCCHGAKVSIIQRGPATVVDLDPTALVQYQPFYSDLPTELCDLFMHSFPYPAMIEANQAFARFAAESDAEMLSGLASAGFKTDYGSDGSGHFVKYCRRGGGYYFNVGAADLIISGDIKVRPFDEVSGFDRDGLVLKDGGALAADLVVFATGYKGPEQTLEQIFGKAVAERIGPVWGYDESGEINNMYKRTNVPGLSMIAGGIPEVRTYSLYLALQIQAIELGLIPKDLPFAAARTAEPVAAGA